MGTFFDDASLVMIPSGVKESKLYSIKPTDGTGDFTFTRGTDTATRVNSAGLIEKETQNLLLQSNTFDTTWTLSNATVTGGHSGYDGTNTAWELERTGTSGFLYQVNAQSGVITFSFYAKENSLSWLRVVVDSGTNADAYINLSDGSVGGGSSYIDVNTYDVGNDWYRISITHNDSAHSNYRIYPAVNDGDISGTSGNIYIQDAQLEQSLVARTYIDTTTAAVYAGITDNLPRLDYSGGASCPALLLEPSRTNLIDQSEYFGSWLTLNSSATDNAAISPEGFTNAAALVDNATNGAHYLQSAVITHATGEDMMASVFLKKGTRSQASVRLSGGTSDAYFNLDDGSVISENGCTATVEDYGNGWYRCAIFDTSAAFGSGRLQVMSAVNGNSTYVGDGTEAIYIYGAQYEHNASYPTSYIPTYGSSATRSKDVCNGAGDASTFNDSEGVLFAEIASLVDNNDGSKSISISSGGYSNNIIMQYTTNINQIVFKTSPSYSTPIFQSYNVSDITENSKIAFKYKLNDCSFWYNGVKLGSVTSFTPFSSGTLTELNFNRGDGNETFEGKTKQVIVFPTALTDSELATLTTL